jgi:hypothetical protein
MDATMLKSRWVEILDHLEAVSRAAWLAMFDGRIQQVDDDVITLDFSDATKFAGVHGYERDSRSAQFVRALEESITAVTGEKFRIVLTSLTSDPYTPGAGAGE